MPRTAAALSYTPFHHLLLLTSPLLSPTKQARIHPEKALGVEIGDIHVVRNAGGRAVEALRSVAISQQLLGTTEVYIVSCERRAFSRQPEWLPGSLSSSPAA